MLAVLGFILTLGDQLPLGWHEAILVAGLSLIALWAVLWFLSQRSPRSREPDMTPHERIERLKQQDGIQRDMQQLMTEIQTMTQRLGEELEEKSERLKRLMNHAQAKIDELQRLNDLPVSKENSPPSPEQKNAEIPAQPSPRSPLPASSRIAAAMTPSNVAPASPSVAAANPNRQPPRSATAARLASMAPSPRATPTSAISNQQSADSSTNLVGSVYRLADQGESSIDIARKLNEQVGKVELILALRQV